MGKKNCCHDSVILIHTMNEFLDFRLYLIHSCERDASFHFHYFTILHTFYQCDRKKIWSHDDLWWISMVQLMLFLLIITMLIPDRSSKVHLNACYCHGCPCLLNHCHYYEDLSNWQLLAVALAYLTEMRKISFKYTYIYIYL